MLWRERTLIYVLFDTWIKLLTDLRCTKAYCKALPPHLAVAQINVIDQSQNHQRFVWLAKLPKGLTGEKKRTNLSNLSELSFVHVLIFKALSTYTPTPSSGGFHWTPGSRLQISGGSIVQTEKRGFACYPLSKRQGLWSTRWIFASCWRQHVLHAGKSEAHIQWRCFLLLLQETI